MKNFLLLITVLSIFSISKTTAQIVNNDFENWKIDTFYFAAGTIGNLPADTTAFNDPVGWTSSNVLTKLDSVGGKTFVTQSANAHSGSSAIQMITDTILLPVIPNLPFTRVALPGFAVNGSFDIGAISLGSVSVISPASITGAGQPIAQRLASINGYYKYSPVFNTNTHFNDTCVVWATLKKGSTVVADAVFKSTDSTSGYLPFSADFNYYTCDMPDTLVILMASSVPNVYTFLGGTNGLQRGSKLLVDSIYYDALPVNYMFAPFAKNDLVTVYQNTPTNINVLANDTDCSGTQLNVSLVTNPNHGSASVINNQILYTPANNYLGLDSMFYKDTNQSGDTAIALLTVFVSVNNTGIKDVNQIDIQLYPVPASNELNIRFDNPGKCTAKIFDVVGNIITSVTLSGNDNAIPLNLFANGVYSIQIENKSNLIIGRSKFIVTK